MRRVTLRHVLAGSVLASVTLLVALGGLAHDRDQSGRRAPPRFAAWQYQLDGRVIPSTAADVWDVDGADTPTRVVGRLRRRGGYAICYFSAGTYEQWRRDRARFPRSALGKPNGWPGERWLDIRRLGALAPIMRARLEVCRAKGFDAVEADNVDGYSNDTGFAISAREQLRYNRWLARTAHRRGLAIGLKNDLEQAPALVGAFDFAVVEECIERAECAMTGAFTRRGKPVFDVEYRVSRAQACNVGRAARLNVLVQTTRLDRPGVPCPAPPADRG
jgi:hypothetical protein